MSVLIVGGGLSGLALADALQREGIEYTLVEARARLGGRIKPACDSGGGFDLGPAWFWPGQPRLKALIEELHLDTSQQCAQRDTLFEGPDGQVQQARGLASMQGSLRLNGGWTRLVTGLAGRLPPDRLRLNTPVTALKQTATGVTAITRQREAIEAQHVVLALPPRLAASLAFDPMLPESACTAMRDIPTWMAGHAKAVAVYDTAFWRDAGLSGDVSSRHGPMVEIHDASAAPSGAFALFGFIGIPPDARTDHARLNAQIIAQLMRLFGPDAAHPRHLFVKDWAYDPYTATPLDHVPLYAHPAYRLPGTLQNLWQGKLSFAGTEVAPQFGGYLEGALESADHVLRDLRV